MGKLKRLLAVLSMAAAIVALGAGTAFAADDPLECLKELKICDRHPVTQWVGGFLGGDPTIPSIPDVENP
ncbi:MAG TPA: hypothetical protein VM841_04135 [Actinomycetota bacterium]|nr:hypothetical protein [Actinomycetota bacterium]